MSNRESAPKNEMFEGKKFWINAISQGLECHTNLLTSMFKRNVYGGLFVPGSELNFNVRPPYEEPETNKLSDDALKQIQQEEIISLPAFKNLTKKVSEVLPQFSLSAPRIDLDPMPQWGWRKSERQPLGTHINNVVVKFTLEPNPKMEPRVANKAAEMKKEYLGRVKTFLKERLLDQYDREKSRRDTARPTPWDGNEIFYAPIKNIGTAEKPEYIFAGVTVEEVKALDEYKEAERLMTERGATRFGVSLHGPFGAKVDDKGDSEYFQERESNTKWGAGIFTTGAQHIYFTWS